MRNPGRVAIPHSELRTCLCYPKSHPQFAQPPAIGQRRAVGAQVQLRLKIQWQQFGALSFDNPYRLLAHHHNAPLTVKGQRPRLLLPDTESELIIPHLRSGGKGRGPEVGRHPCPW